MARICWRRVTTTAPTYSEVRQPVRFALSAEPRKAGLRGKAKGTVSRQYREIMARVVADGNGYLPPDLWAVAARECGFYLSAKGIRDWLGRGAGAAAGYVERLGDAYRVSPLAIELFHFETAKPSPEASGDGSV